MSQKWEYVTITINPDSNALEGVSPAQVIQGRKGASADAILTALGKDGWELVTSYNAGSYRSPNLVFKRAIEE